MTWGELLSCVSWRRPALVCRVVLVFGLANAAELLYSIVKDLGLTPCLRAFLIAVEHAGGACLIAENRKLLKTGEIEFSLLCEWELAALRFATEGDENGQWRRDIRKCR